MEGVEGEHPEKDSTESNLEDIQPKQPNALNKLLPWLVLLLASLALLYFLNRGCAKEKASDSNIGYVAPMPKTTHGVLYPTEDPDHCI